MGTGHEIFFEKSCERGMEQQEACKKPADFFPIEKEKSLDADDPHPPAIVTCAREKHEYHYSEPEKTTLHFSTFNAEGALLKQFSVQVNSHQPFVVSACRNLLLLEGYNSFLCNIATQDLITIPGITAYFIPFGYVTSTEESGGFSHGDFSFFKSGGLKVLTLGTDRWRDAKDPPLPIRMFRTTDGAFVNGALYFRTQDRRIAWIDHGPPCFAKLLQFTGGIQRPPMHGGWVPSQHLVVGQQQRLVNPSVHYPPTLPISD